MVASSQFIIRPPESPEELTEHVKGHLETFPPDVVSEDIVTRRVRRLTTYPGYRREQIRCAYRDGKLLGGCRIYERQLRMGAARLATGCVGGVHFRASERHQGIATALMQDAIAYAQTHDYALLLLDGIPKFYHRYGYTDVYDLFTVELDRRAVLALPDPS